MDCSPNSTRGLRPRHYDEEHAAPVIQAHSVAAQQDIDKKTEREPATANPQPIRAEFDRKSEVASCEICGKRCCTPRGLTIHRLRTHGIRTQRIYRCCHCQYSNAQKWMVDRHERIHTGKKPYVCEVCLAAFNRNDHLTKHLFVHVRTNETPFECTCCLLRFRASSTLYAHKQRYSHY